MTKLKLAAATLAVFALASPAVAQPVITNPGKCAQYYPDANCQNLGPGNPYTGSYQWRGAAYNSYPSYVQQNGFTCTPGAWFRGDDGRRHRCR